MKGRFRFKKNLDKKDLKRSILVIKPGAIGDVLQMTPIVRALKRNLPDSNVLFLVGSPIALELLGHNPYINERFMFQKGRGIREVDRVLGLSKYLRAKKIDMILNYQPNNWRWRFLSFFSKPKMVFLYKKQKRIKKGERIRHAVEDHLALLSKLGIREEDPHLDFFLTMQEIEEAKALIKGHTQENKCKGTVCLNMGASHPVNRWPVNAFYRLNSILTTAGFKVILIGGAEDRIIVDQFLGIGPSKCLDLVGHLSIRKTAAILSHCDVLVSGDTGPLHLATSVGTKVTGLFGAADPERTGPIGSEHVVIQSNLPCVPCRRRHCKNGKRLCMEAIKPEVVAAKIYDIFHCGKP